MSEHTDNVTDDGNWVRDDGWLAEVIFEAE